jgi:hypothetical protein
MNNLQKIYDISFKCFIQCIFNVSGIYKDGKLDRDALIKSLATKVNNQADVLETLTNAVDSCMSLDNRALFEKILVKIQSTSACDPNAAALVRCIKTNVFKVILLKTLVLKSQF